MYHELWWPLTFHTIHVLDIICSVKNMFRRRERVCYYKGNKDGEDEEGLGVQDVFRTKDLVVFIAHTFLRRSGKRLSIRLCANVIRYVPGNFLFWIRPDRNRPEIRPKPSRRKRRRRAPRKNLWVTSINQLYVAPNLVFCTRTRITYTMLYTVHDRVGFNTVPRSVRPRTPCAVFGYNKSKPSRSDTEPNDMDRNWILNI